MTESIITFSRALADPTRWRIIRLVLDHALCVCELADILEMPQSSVSSHVQVIRKAGLLESEKREKWTYFHIDPHHQPLIRTLESFFAASDSATHHHDSTRASQRLAARAESCCPGPISLLS